MKPGPEIKQLKAELRKIYLHKRNSIDPAIKKIWDEQIFQRLLKLPPFVKARLIMTYLSIKSEVDTFKLVHHLLELGKRVAVP
ncbi:MAG: 5-formyltetrahydrofolate cyclo-ligase, partial [Candidatus Sumerlaeia bacterium]|nr:5-formyltetrahydrofolate cyclo-ligase [Candidatus Sumerlaeia bacterium]